MSPIENKYATPTKQTITITKPPNVERKSKKTVKPKGNSNLQSVIRKLF